MRRRDLLRLAATVVLAACGRGTAVEDAGVPTTEPPVDPPPQPPVEAAPSASPPSPAPAPVTVDLLCRDAWQARAAGDGMASHTIRQLTVHHPAASATTRSQGPAHFRSYQAHHQDNLAWADIAYHVGIDRTGHVFMLREWDHVGDTGTDYDPATHFLVLVDGHFDEHDPSPAQLESLARVLAWASGHFGVGLDTVAGHRDYASTSCPGEALHARLPAVVERSEALAAVGVQLREVCGDEADAVVAAIEAGTAPDAVMT